MFEAEGEGEGEGGGGGGGGASLRVACFVYRETQSIA